MQLKRDTHIFIDPTVDKNSGISSYCELAHSLLDKEGRFTYVLKRRNDENLENFRMRIFNLVNKEGSNIIQIEAPESGASTLLLHHSLPVHIRLHCARSLGSFWSGEEIEPIMHTYEQDVINRARWLSAPTFAAWRETQRLFTVNSAYIFPNPAPEHQNNISQNRSGFLLVGRGHVLKGVFFLPSLLKKIPKEIPVTLVGAGMFSVARKLGVSDRVLAYDFMEKDKIFQMMKNSMGVLVISPFETFSMVAAEALSLNTPVITWSHSGAAELGAYPFVRAIQPWNIDEMAKVVIDLNHNPIKSTIRFAKNFNLDYLSGATSLFLSEPPQLWVDMCEKKSLVDHPAEISLMKNVYSQSTFTRKLKKLKKNPLRFIKDMWIMKILKDTTLTKIENGLQDSYGISIIDSLNKDFEGLKYPVLIQNQNANKSININKINGIDSKLRSVLTILDSNCKFEISLLREIKRLSKDSSLLDERHICLGYFYDFGEPSLPIDLILKNIAPNQRVELAHTQNIIACRSSYSIARALRACHSGTRLFIIVLPNDPPLEIPSNEIDTLIVPLGYVIQKNTVKRVLYYPNLADPCVGVAGAILRACQEASPKPLEVLLPIFGCYEFDPTLLQVDTQLTQGILFLECSEEDICDVEKIKIDENFGTHISYIFKFISGIMICENAFWRYKSFIDSVEGKEDWVNFLRSAIADGLRFEVRVKNKKNEIKIFA